MMRDVPLMVEMTRRIVEAVKKPVTVKTRYRAPDGACEVASVDAESIDLSFPVPQWAATPGQSAVLYQGEVCLGGGFIDTIDNADIPQIRKA